MNKKLAVGFTLAFLLIGTAFIYAYFVVRSPVSKGVTSQLVSTKTTAYFNGDLVSPPLQNTSVFYQNSSIVHVNKGQTIQSEWVTYRETFCFIMTQKQFEDFRFVLPSLQENYSYFESWINDKTHYADKLLSNEGFLSYNVSVTQNYLSVLADFSGFFTNVYTFDTYLISYNYGSTSNVFLLYTGTAFFLLAVISIFVLLYVRHRKTSNLKQ